MNLINRWKTDFFGREEKEIKWYLYRRKFILPAYEKIISIAINYLQLRVVTQLKGSEG